MMGSLAHAAVVVALAFPGPVFAAAAPAVAQPAMADVILTGEIQPPVYLSANVEELNDVELVFDLSGVAGVATVQIRPGFGTCTIVATSATCRFHLLVKQDDGFFRLELLNIAPVEGAAPGSHGTIGMTASAGNAATGSHTVEVTIGNRVDLGVDDPQERSSTTRAGDLVELPLHVAAGREAVNGVAVVFELASLLRKADDFSNCRYVSAGPLACIFDTALQPNVRYRLATPLRLRADPTYRQPFGTRVVAKATWVTAAEQTGLADLRRQLGQAAGQPGRGGKLTLVPVDAVGSATSAAVPQGDADTRNNWEVFKVAVVARDASNFSAILLKPAPDRFGTLHALMGIRNNGPSTVNVPGGNANGAVVRAPGTHFFHTPPGCVFYPEEPAGPGHPYPSFEYLWCGTGPLLRAGDTVWFDFPISEVHVGGIAINEPELGYPVIDPNPDDDYASFLNPTPSGGGLPVTGNPTALFVMAAVLFLLTGTLVRYFTRRKPGRNPTATDTAPSPPG